MVVNQASTQNGARARQVCRLIKIKVKTSVMKRQQVFITLSGRLAHIVQTGFKFLLQIRAVALKNPCHTAAFNIPPDQDHLPGVVRPAIGNKRSTMRQPFNKAVRVKKH